MEAWEEKRRAIWVMRVLGAILALLLLTTGIAIHSMRGSGAHAVVGLGSAIFVAALMVGAFLGFLFSVPRVLARGATEAAVGAVPAGTQAQRLLETNTNLERISDWLTTLIVGAGLTQVARAGEALASFSAFVGTASAPLGPVAARLPGLAPMILVTGVILGFLAMYLYTRIEITRLFRHAELDCYLDRDAQRAVANAIQRAPSAAPLPTPSLGSISVEDALDLMFSMLYDGDAGYARVIDLAGRLSSSSAVARPEYWFYLAAAFGQQHGVATAEGDQELRQSARDNALDAARRAVRIDPSYRDRLRALATPGGNDDDLATLAEDPDMRRVLEG
ncbi:hypothetical protein ASG29_12455 [Sphingomonas sp. Leaf412]|uniref:hypothetical protein n=1 Tax=Sphingomonas sp. Leaf412 TaxID=1736370 RepID=UPI0006FFBB72|nr:hypothetical protein [Sphingomonas sp. Leaf412]KQT32569.1 hypothetical protein ASG29_12455 [Sphingomonas sp. Leaf412]